jgi:tRNA G10  N-methylase Trm11
VRSVLGTDRSSPAIAIAQANLAAAKIKTAPQTKFTCCDFRDHASLAGIGPGSVTLIITNPPMGKRVPIANLRGLIDDLLAVAATTLKPGGRLVFANPLPSPMVPPSLKLQSKQIVDFNGFDCRLEKYVKIAR